MGVGVVELAEREAERRCVAVGAEIEEVWGSSRRLAIGDAFLASGHPEAKALFRRSARWLDDYAASWRDERTALCRATRAGEAEAPAAALACLEGRRLALETLTQGVFARADRDIVVRSVSAAAELPPLGPCSDPAALARAPAQPSAEAELAGVAALRRRHEEAKALASAGKYPAAIEATDRLIVDVEASDYGPLLIDVGLTKAGLLIRAGDSEGAEALFEETLWRAASAGDDASVAEAAAMLTYVVGYLRARPEEGLRWGRMARAALERSGDRGGTRSTISSSSSTSARSRSPGRSSRSASVRSGSHSSAPRRARRRR